MTHPHTTHAALVLFTAEASVTCKSFDPDAERAALIGQALRHQLIETIGQTLLPADIVLATEHPFSPALRHQLTTKTQRHIHEYRQRGNGFEERLNNAIQAAASHGHTRLVLLGDDTPTLESTDINTALEHDELVIGPSCDGGFYLLGINTCHLHLLDNIPWQTPDTFEALRNTALKHGIAVRILAQRADIDTKQDAIDAAPLIATVVARYLARAVRNLLCVSIPTPLGLAPCAIDVGVAAPRGPPAHTTQAVIR